jgi:hypothetical protein
MLRHDRHALEGMPLKLVIVALMMAISVPTLYDVLGNYRVTNSTAVLKGQVETVQDAVKELSRCGPGNQRTVQLTLPVDGSGYIIIGGSSMSESMSVAYGSANKEPVRTYFTDPNVKFITPGEAGILLQGGDRVIVLRSVESTTGMTIEVIT